MNEIQIDELERCLEHTAMIWIGPDGKAFSVKAIGEPPKEEVTEPSRCAYFNEGGYVALWNAEAESFYLATQIFPASEQ